MLPRWRRGLEVFSYKGDWSQISTVTSPVVVGIVKVALRLRISIKPEILTGELSKVR